MCKRITTMLFLLTSIICVSQNQVCVNSESEIADLNTIGKCAIEKFKSSKSKEFIQVSSRSRYVRKRSVHLEKLKDHLKTVPVKKQVVVSSVKEVVKTDKGSSSNSLGNVNLKGESLIKSFLRFDEVTRAPIFITCDGTSSNENKNECNKETIVGIILENMVYPFDAAAEGIQGKVWVRFIINKEGYVKNITTQGPKNGELLEEEAERLVNLLPTFMPGKHNNEYVNVEYFMPIEFHLE